MFDRVKSGVRPHKQLSRDKKENKKIGNNNIVTK
jgi:hypothetical protein